VIGFFCKTTRQTHDSPVSELLNGAGIVGKFVIGIRSGNIRFIFLNEELFG
jgi:hypothetical protein